MSELPPSASLTLRPATAEDTEFARAVHRAAYHDVVMRQFGSWDGELQATYFDRTWSQKGFQIVLADNEPCGYIKVEHLPTEMRIDELVIAPSFQGRGIGSSILRDWQHQAAEQGLPLKLAVLKDNRAKVLYERMGFVPTSETETHILMQWSPPSFSSPQRAL